MGIGRVGDWSSRHPIFLVALGAFVLGASSLDITTGLAVGLVVALFTLLIANLQPVDPALGPHH